MKETKIIMDFGPGMVKTALLSDGVLTECLVDKKERISISGNIYMGRIDRVIPNQFAFINIGEEKNGFLQIDDAKQSHLFDTIKTGMEIMVQAVKDGEGEKGPALSAEITLPGRYMVLIGSGPENSKKVNISSKIEEKAQRARLETLLSPLLPPHLGVIARTECAGADESLIKEELAGLMAAWAAMEQKSRHVKAPALLYGENLFYGKTLKTLLPLGIDRIICNAKEAMAGIAKISAGYVENDKIELYTGGLDIFDCHRITEQLDKAFRQKLWLNSGGFIIIEETSACTVIDVNTGKFVSQKSRERTVLKNNLEAAAEIAKQIRLRNISGAVIIDFVDMKDEDNKKRLIACLRKELKKDRIPVHLVSFSSLSLVQLTRKKTRGTLANTMLHACPACGGTGKIFDREYTAWRILISVQRILSGGIFNCITVEAGRQVLSVLRHSGELKELKAQYGAEIILNEISVARLDYFEIAKEKKGDSHGE